MGASATPLLLETVGLDGYVGYAPVTPLLLEVVGLDGCVGYAPITRDNRP